MTREEAIRILDPVTSMDALEEIEYYAGFRGEEAVRKAVDEACILAVAAIREQEKREVVAEAPTVDAVEVVRCRECKWYMPGDLFTDIMFCHRLKKDNGKPAKYNYCADDFCSYGEREDGDGNG